LEASVGDHAGTSISVLGALEVTRDGERIPLGSPRQRRLLALLLTHANEVVSSDRLVDTLWGDDNSSGGVGEPGILVARLHTLVSRLRTTLGDFRLETRPPGYRLALATDELDALRFEQLVRVGVDAADRPRVALGALDEALALWRGSPYQEFVGEEFAEAEVARLVELHARAVEERSAALLDLERPEDIIEQLEVEIGSQPFRERLRALLMLALARSGRTVESLRAYESFRRFLADEVGVAPSPELQELNNEISRQHPDIGWSSSPRSGARAAALPTGTVTFLFTDLEGSTRLWEEHPKAMHETLARHDQILRDAIESNDGHVVKTTGDGTHGVFSTARRALDAAIAAQRALCNEEWGETGPLHVRIGIHTGDAESRSGDYYGIAVNRAARLMGIAHGQQILVSLATEQLVGDDLPPDVQLLDLGFHRLRDVSTAEHVFQVVHPELREQFPPLRTLDDAAALPIPATTFLGRADELAELGTLVSRPGTVTLVGPGGVGKTRLAIELAADVGHQFLDGVRIVDLAPIGADSVPATVAHGLGLVRRGRRSFRDSIVEWLARKHLLLVVDNCEHVLDAVAPLIRNITESSADVTVLCTSRQPLGFPGETIFAVEPLSLPSADDGGPLESSPAVRLFVDRAQAARHGLTLTSEQLELVAQICRRLDGIPLAMELAAARARSMSLHDLLAHLDPQSPLFAAATPDHPRHRTLLSTIEWSYDLLPRENRAMFERLSVFSGSWTLGAACQVCADELDAHEVLSLLTDLADRSMIVADFGQHETRYHMLSTLRDFAADRLVAAGEAAGRRALHAEHYCGLAEGAAPELRTADEARWITLLAADFANLHLAHLWSIENSAVDLEARLLVALWNYGLQRLSAEYFRWVEVALDSLSFEDHPSLADLHGIAALGAWLRGDLRRCMQSCRAAFDAEEQLGTGPTLPARMAIIVAAAYAPPGNPELEPIVAEVPGRFLEIVEWTRALGDPFWLGYSMVTGSLGMVMAGDVERAALLARRALEAARRSGCPSSIAYALFAVATAVEQTDAEQAEQLLDESVPAARSVESRLVLGLSMSLQATLQCRLGRPLDATPLLLELLDYWDRLGNLPQLWHTVRETARCLSLLGEDATAARLLASVSGVELVMPLLPTDRTWVTETTEELRHRLGDDEFAAASTEGAGMAREAAVELAARTLAEVREFAAKLEPSGG
jgi:predicted ATPase/class 3 adenylate cyclase